MKPLVVIGWVALVLALMTGVAMLPGFYLRATYAEEKLAEQQKQEMHTFRVLADKIEGVGYEEFSLRRKELAERVWAPILEGGLNDSDYMAYEWGCEVFGGSGEGTAMWTFQGDAAQVRAVMPPADLKPELFTVNPGDKVSIGYYVRICLRNGPEISQ